MASSNVSDSVADRRRNASSTASTGVVERRHDLDWLRVLAFGLLIYFHAAIPFIPGGGLPLIENATSSMAIAVPAMFLHEFRLGLLFLISGVGVAFAFRSRDAAAFLKERTRRLVVPLVFGVLILVPPMVFLEKRFLGAFDGSIWEFYPRFFIDGVYPGGNLSWHHYWFVAYLYLFCWLCVPLFLRLRTDIGATWLAALAREGARSGRLYWFIAVLAVPEVALRAFFPGFRDLIHDWASFAHWFLLFVAGFVFASCLPLLQRVETLRRVSFALALGATTLLFMRYWSWDAARFTPDPRGDVAIGEYVIFCVIRMANVWFWLLTLLGYGGRYLQKPHRVLTYLNQAVYPLFCMHLTLVVALSYIVVPLTLGVWPKYLLIATGTTVLALAIYHLIVAPTVWLRPMFGLTSARSARRCVHAGRTSADE